MTILKTVKNLLVTDILIGVGLTLAVLATTGIEGLASAFCEVTNVQRCAEVEWSATNRPSNLTEDTLEVQ